MSYKEVQLPDHLNTDPQMQSARAKLADLQARLTQVNADINTAETALVTQGKRDDDNLRRAHALLNGAASSTATTEKALADLRQQKNLLRTAINLQEREVARIQSELSAQICETLRPQHRKLARDVFQAAVLLGKAIQAEQCWRAELEARDVQTSHLQQINFALVDLAGDPRDPYSALSMWFQEAAQHGFIDLNEVPEPWRVAWKKSA